MQPATVACNIQLWQSQSAEAKTPEPDPIFKSLPAMSLSVPVTVASNWASQVPVKPVVADPTKLGKSTQAPGAGAPRAELKRVIPVPSTTFTATYFRLCPPVLQTSPLNVCHDEICTVRNSSLIIITVDGSSEKNRNEFK